VTAWTSGRSSSWSTDRGLGLAGYTSGMRVVRLATAMVLDIRDFTPTFQAATEAGTQERFLGFLEEVYRECLRACEATGAAPGDGTLYTASTGDGIVAVFMDDQWHAEQAFAAALVLCERLPPVFAARGFGTYKQAVDNFGIGLESGVVYVVKAGTDASTVTTCIGNAINIAARLEAHTKILFRTPLIIGGALNNLLCERLQPGFGYLNKVSRVLDPSADTSAFGALFAEMDGMNRELRVKFLNHLYLKGVGDPVAAFRYSPSLAQERGPIFRLLEKLFDGDSSRLHGVRALVQ
jgi:class 3 adenylate cyclase